MEGCCGSVFVEVVGRWVGGCRGGVCFFFSCLVGVLSVCCVLSVVVCGWK